MAGEAGRSTLDRVAMRVPARIFNLLGTRYARLRPGSRLRARLSRLAFANAFAAVNRSDVEAVLVAYEPDAEVWTSGMEATGLRDCYRGHDGIREMFGELDDVFSSWTWEVDDVVDLGDQAAVRINFTTRGRASGLETLVKDAGSAYRFSPQGKVARQDFFMDRGGWQQALDAVAA